MSICHRHNLKLNPWTVVGWGGVGLDGWEPCVGGREETGKSKKESPIILRHVFFIIFFFLFFFFFFFFSFFFSFSLLFSPFVSSSPLVSSSLLSFLFFFFFFSTFFFLCFLFFFFLSFFVLIIYLFLHGTYRASLSLHRQLLLLFNLG